MGGFKLSWPMHSQSLHKRSASSEDPRFAVLTVWECLRRIENVKRSVIKAKWREIRPWEIETSSGKVMKPNQIVPDQETVVIILGRKNIWPGCLIVGGAHVAYTIDYGLYSVRRVPVWYVQECKMSAFQFGYLLNHGKLSFICSDLSDVVFLIGRPSQIKHIRYQIDLGS